MIHVQFMIFYICISQINEFSYCNMHGMNRNLYLITRINRNNSRISWNYLRSKNYPYYFRQNIRKESNDFHDEYEHAGRTSEPNELSDWLGALRLI